MVFSQLLGNEVLKKRLSGSAQQGKWSHCYVICGPEGSGKRTLAGLMAAAMQCEEAHAPCGHCNICRKVQAGIHPDVITVDDAEKKTVQVELIRQLQADAFVHPNEGKKKIYLIPRAQDMTESAQNALLKLIEEPPSYAVFLLLAANPGKLLSTVRSRSVELRMEPVEQKQALAFLQQKHPEETLQNLEAAYVRSGGFLGRSLQLLQQEALPQTELFGKAFAQKDRYELTKLLASMEKMPRDQVLNCLGSWKQLLTEAISARNAMAADARAQALGSSRTAQELAMAAANIQKAMELTAANIGVGHICGWLAASLS